MKRTYLITFKLTLDGGELSYDTFRRHFVTHVRKLWPIASQLEFQDLKCDASMIKDFEKLPDGN